MKFTAALTFAIAAMSSVAALPSDTNANRLARGLPPLPPRNLATPVELARRAKPSGKVTTSLTQCSTVIQCCQGSGTPSDPLIEMIATMGGITDLGHGLVGVTCSPLAADSSHCHGSSRSLCCSNVYGSLATNCEAV